MGTIGERPRRASPPEVDALWGERTDLAGPIPTFMGDWGMELTPHGIEHLSFAGEPVVPRLFFSVRDQSWGSPLVPMTYVTTGVGPSPSDQVAFEARVEGYPLEVSGGIVAAGQSLRVSFRLEVGDDVDVTRIGPCVLHYVLGAGETITTDRPGDSGEAKIAQEISYERIASGYRTLSYSVGLTRLTVEFEGGLFEMEDQRNWTDNTFKSYTPPLSDPRPLHLCKDQVLTYSVLLTAVASHSGPKRAPSRLSPPSVTVRAAGPTETSCSLPEMGVVHPGGPLSPVLMSQLVDARPSFLHILADMTDSDWKESLRADLLTVSKLGSMAVLTVNCPPGEWRDLKALAGIGPGSIDTAFLFEPGQPVTSDALAEAGRLGFDGTGVRVGAGTRGHFANLNLAGRVPDAAEVVGVSLAAAAHDDDRRALTTGLGTYPQIFGQVRRLAGEREVYAGPVGFGPTFDSWSATGFELSVREAWERGHLRDRSVFAAAWFVAAVAILSGLGPKRVCISGALGPTSRADLAANPVLRALAAVRKLSGGTITALRAGDRIGGLSAPASSLVAVMTDEALEMLGLPGPVQVICGAEEVAGGRPRTTEGPMPTPSVLALTVPGPIDLIAGRGV